jgi:hypothetical protein
MALWRCSHCGTPQPVAARCWVCRRSSTSCGTCRHFRESVAARIGYCGLDRERRPLAGDEIRGCWDGLALADDEDSRPADVALRVIEAPYVRGFVPVDELLAEAVIVVPVELDLPSKSEQVVVPPAVAAVSPPSDGMLWADFEG